MSNSASNNLPFVPENTIDPAAGLNLTIADLDIILNISCLGFYDAPPLGLTDGDRLIVATGSGDFAGYDDYIAQYISEGDLFRFIAPTEGMRATIKEDGGYGVEYYDGAWRVSQGIRSQMYTHDFTTDANEIATDLPPDCPVIIITDSGTVLTGARTLTLPDVRLAPIISVFNTTTESITIKGHGDAGPGVSIAAPYGFLWVINFGPVVGQPIFLASMSAPEFLGGIASLDPDEKRTARNGLGINGVEGIGSRTSTSNTLISSDAGRFIETTNAAPNTLTFNSGVFAVNDKISGAQGGAGQTTLVAGAGVTLKSRNGLKLKGQDAIWTAVCVAPDVFRIGGELEA